MAPSYQETVRRIVDAFSGLTPELRKAAKFILENPEEVGLKPEEALASKRLTRAFGGGGRI